MVLGAEFLVLDSLGLMTVSLFPLGHNESNLLCLGRERVLPSVLEWNRRDSSLSQSLVTALYGTICSLRAKGDIDRVIG